MVRILVINDKEALRATGPSTWRDLDIVHVIADGVTHGTQIEGPLRAGYLFIEIPGPAPTDPIGDTGGMLAVDAVWRDLMNPELVDILRGIDPDTGLPVYGAHVRQKRQIDFNGGNIPQLNRVRNQGGGTFTPEQVRAFLQNRSPTK